MVKTLKSICLLLTIINCSAFAIDGVNCNDFDIAQTDVPLQELNPEQEKEYRKLFEYNKEFSLKEDKEDIIYRSDYIRRSIIIRSTIMGDSKPVQFHAYFYQTRISGENPLILIMPTIKGVSPMEKRIAKKFAKQGLNSLVFVVPRDKEIHTKAATELNRAVKYFVTGTQLFIDHFSKVSIIDKNKIGLFAISDGANRSSVLLGYEQRIKAAVLYLAGGNYPTMLTSSDQRIIRGYRNYKMENMNLDSNGFLELMQNSLSFDPLHLTQYRNPDDLYMVLALKDTSVPTANQFELWRAFGKPESKCLELDHIKGALTSLLDYQDTIDFFKEKFSRK